MKAKTLKTNAKYHFRPTLLRRSSRSHLPADFRVGHLEEMADRINPRGHLDDSRHVLSERRISRSAIPDQPASIHRRVCSSQRPSPPRMVPSHSVASVHIVYDLSHFLIFVFANSSVMLVERLTFNLQPSPFDF